MLQEQEERIHGNEEEKWLFADTQNVYKNLYCVQSGNSHSTSYDVYDLYTIDDNSINTYFGNLENYKHFMWILENMYLVNMNSTDKTYMETQLLSKLDETAKAKYEAMPNELLGFYTRADAKIQNESADKIVNGDNLMFHLYRYDSTKKKTVKTSDTVNVTPTDNFLKTIQNYVLLHHIKQRGGQFGADPLDEYGNIALNLRTYSDDVSTFSEEIDNTTASKQFAHKLIEYLESKYNSETYDINKYKNFNTGANNVIIDKNQASYNSSDYKIGPFYITNKYGFNVNIDSVGIGTNNLTDYKIVDNNGQEINLSGKNIDNKEFYIKFDSDVRSGKEDSLLQVNYSVDYGEIPAARIFIPTGGGENPQTLIDVERTHKTDSGTWSETVEGINPDIALKKYIYQVNGQNIENRLVSIDTSTIESTNNATYNMIKTPITVNIGDTITYVIQLFNEGNVDGRAAYIADYLPEGLEVKRVYGNNTDVEISIQTDTAIYFKNPYDTYISAYNGEDATEFEAKSQKIYVECKVVGMFEGIYTNVAEIAGYQFVQGNDIDSWHANWKIDLSTFNEYWNEFWFENGTDRQSELWKNYSNNQNDWLDGQAHPFVGQEDDDDFDKFKVKIFDLALTKSFSWKYDENGNKVPLTTENSTFDKTKLDISGQAEIIAETSHDLNYNMNKEAANVVVGDKVIARIRVYNEGKIDGIVKEITDYLPTGLNFLQDETINENLDIYSFRYVNSNKIIVTVNGDDGATIGSLTEGESPNYIELNIVCEVTEAANGILYNSAAITKYGYNYEGIYVEAKDKNIDIDSYQTVNNSYTLKQTHQKNWKNKSNSELGAINKSELDVEDDDDIDCIKVVYKPEFDLALRKNIYKIEKKLRKYKI